MNNISFYQITWPIAMEHVRAFTTKRGGGVSLAPYDSFNLAHHVNDEPSHVLENRDKLTQYLSHQIEGFSPNNIFWLTQTHSTDIIITDEYQPDNAIADGLVSRHEKEVCCVLTADCLPVFIADIQGSVVAVVHAGWRGLCDGIIEKTLDKFKDILCHSLADDEIATFMAENIQVAFGPAIGPCCFEVGQDVKDAFTRHTPQDSKHFALLSSVKSSEQPNHQAKKYHANIYQLAISRLQQYGIHHIGAEPSECTVCQSNDYYSYRRESDCGRMASIIWR